MVEQAGQAAAEGGKEIVLTGVNIGDFGKTTGETFFDLVKALDGTLYLACNPVGENWGARSPISLLISKDGGAHWEHLTHLVTMPGEYSYPAVLWQDGCLLITHTWQRKSIQFWKIRL